MRKLLASFLTGLGLAIWWGVFSLSAEADWTDRLVTLLVTITIAYLHRYHRDSIICRLAFAIPITCYYILFLLTDISLLEKALSPFSLYLILALVLVSKKIRVPLLLLITVYSGCLLKLIEYHSALNSSRQDKFIFPREQKKIVDTLPTSFISDYKFINNNNDTIVLPINNRPIVIETWAEWCKPCIKAIKEIAEFKKESNIEYDHYYLYSDKDLELIVDVGNIFNFDLIDQKENIILPIDSKLNDDLGFSGLPSFLYFNKNGKLVTMSTGYKDIDLFRQSLIFVSNQD